MSRMGYMRYEFGINTRATRAMLSGIAGRSADMRPAMTVIKELMIEGHVRNFESQGSFLGAPWPPLAGSTLERKARQGLPPEPMVATGALFRALAGGKGKRTRVGRTSVSVGVTGGENVGDLFYVRMTQKDTSSRQPARPVLGMSDSQRETFVTIVQTFLERGTP